MKHLDYLIYLIKHKYYVAIACWKHGLYWQGLVHDMSKMLPSEWFPYVEFFFSKNSKVNRDKTGYYKPTDTGDKAFDFAWLLHQKRNRHHWQFWILPEDGGGIKLLEMPHKYRLEMLCDWWGASMAQGHRGKSATWYKVNKDKMQLAPKTKKWVEENISDNFLDE